MIAEALQDMVTATEVVAPVAGERAGWYTFASPVNFCVLGNLTGEIAYVRINNAPVNLVNDPGIDSVAEVWTGDNWTRALGELVHTSGDTARVLNAQIDLGSSVGGGGVVAVGEPMWTVFDVNYSSGTGVQLACGTVLGTSRASSATFAEMVTGDASTIEFLPSSDASLALDNVGVWQSGAYEGAGWYDVQVADGASQRLGKGMWVSGVSVWCPTGATVANVNVRGMFVTPANRHWFQGERTIGPG